jgi:hypothetical protein
MTKSECAVGMKVLFGRVGDILTTATITKLNRKTASLTTDESRGSKGPGARWRVDYSLLYPADAPPKPEYPIGLTIKVVRRMTDGEREAEGWEGTWHSVPMVIELSDGSLLYASSDEEGNAAGSIFGRSVTGEHFTLWN